MMKMFCNVIDYLEKTVQKYPNKIAYYDDKDSLSFSELWQNVLQVATALNKEGISKKPIVVFMEKSPFVLGVFWGIACSRNFYTPIDTKMPIQRIRKILETLEPAAVITDQTMYETASNYFDKYKLYLFENLVKETIDFDGVAEKREQIIDTDLLYVLFTSGSTGIPKGVSISHRAVIDFSLNVSNVFGIDQNSKIANQGPFYFDLSVLDIFAPVFVGATMYVTPPELFKFPVKLLQAIRDNKINTIFWVPSALVLVANLRALRAVDVSCLKRIMFCGEVMPNKQLNVWRKHIPEAMYVNMYGPTETTCASTYYIVDREFGDDESLPIGIPFKNTGVLLLNENDEVAREGNVGEICITGSSLAQGYYNNDEKTNEFFVQNPINTKCIDYIYRTGDLAYYNERKELIYVSRKDFQIKHMGHRIELGEIETAIDNVEGISSSCCVYDDKHNKIVAYIVDEVDDDKLLRALKASLPEYMIPNRIIRISSMPLNANGKIDRLQLKKLVEEE